MEVGRNVLRDRRVPGNRHDWSSLAQMCGGLHMCRTRPPTHPFCMTGGIARSTFFFDRIKWLWEKSHLLQKSVPRVHPRRRVGKTSTGSGPWGRGRAGKCTAWPTPGAPTPCRPQGIRRPLALVSRKASWPSLVPDGHFPRHDRPQTFRFSARTWNDEARHGSKAPPNSTTTSPVK